MCLDELRARQAGVVSREQALAAGLSADEIDHRLARRRWRPLHPRVYLTVATQPTPEARVRAAVLWAGEGAVLSGVAAAWWHGMPVRAPATVAVTVPRRRSPGKRPGVTVRRRTLPVPDLDEHRGLPVTAGPLTTVEAALALGPAGAAFLDAVLHRVVGLDDVLAAARRDEGRGERMLREAGERARSAARLRLAGMLRRGGVPARVLAEPGYAAVVCPAARLAVTEAGTPAPAGWAVLEVGPGDLVGRPGWVVAEVLETVAALGRARITG